VKIERDWRPGDTVLLGLPMTVRAIEAHPYVTDNVGKIAVLRGPILYCAEWADNPGIDPRDIAIAPSAEFAVEHRSDLLYGVTVLKTTGVVERVAPHWEGRLYRPVGTEPGRVAAERHALTLIPYFAWGNREHGPMEVWLRAAV
jgi:DUF1680 family protein